jgi:hypothetical protein
MVFLVTFVCFCSASSLRQNWIWDLGLAVHVLKYFALFAPFCG